MISHAAIILKTIKKEKWVKRMEIISEKIIALKAADNGRLT